MIRKVATLGVALAIGAGLLAIAEPANAGTVQPFMVQHQAGPALEPVGGPTPVSPNSCSPDPTYTAWNGTGTFIGDASRVVRGRGPETISLTVTKTDTTGSNFTNTSGVSVSGIVFAAHDDISGGITMSVAAGTTYGASYTPPSGHLGWLQWGNWGYHYYWSYGHYAGCTWVTQSGAANSPIFTGKGFNHGYA